MTREEAVQIIEKMLISHECREFFRLALEALRQPEIVRCKDCKHHDDDYPCELHTIDGSAHDDWFCADGVK